MIRAPLRSLLRRIFASRAREVRPVAPGLPAYARPSLAALLEAHQFPRPLPPEAFVAEIRAAGADPAALRALTRPVGRGRYALTLLEPAWCRELAASTDRLHRAAMAANLPLLAPNTMNRYGVVLDSVPAPGEEPELLPPRLLDLTPLRETLLPLAAALFPQHHGVSLDHHHGFIVRYARDEDLDLGFHADDAEVTLNLCLAGGFTGGDLWFDGPRCASHRDDPSWPAERLTWAHVPGVALIHAGADRHGARPIETGVRQNLILWMRSGAARKADGPKPDGYESSCPAWCTEARAGA